MSVYFSDPVSKYLLAGRVRGPMKWLKGAKRPIPIETSSGLIFRWASSKSFANGRWVHPGKKSYDLFGKIRENVVPILREEARRSAIETVREAWKKMKK